MLLFCILIAFDSVSQKDNYKKNSKISKKERQRYEKDVTEHPLNAEPHWRYANVVAAFKFREAEEAWKYYDKALKIDSTNAAIWTDFADYLLKVHDDKETALYLFQRAQSLEPENQNLAVRIQALTKSIEEIQETIRLRSLGTSDRRKIDHGIKYAVISNLDSLQNITKQVDSPHAYDKLRKRFLEDDLLSEWETYLLCLGYANTEDYSPYTRPAEELYSLNREGNYDKVIMNGQELLVKYPVSPGLYRELMYAHRRKGDQATADRYQRRAQRLYEAMIFTGDGTCETPYITLTTIDEYGLMSYLGLYSTGQQSLLKCNGAETDQLTFQDSDGHEGELYFDVRLLFNSLRKEFKK